MESSYRQKWIILSTSCLIQGDVVLAVVLIPAITLFEYPDEETEQQRRTDPVERAFMIFNEDYCAKEEVNIG